MAKITEIMLLQQPAQNVLAIEHLTDIQTFGRLIGESFMKIGEYLDELGLITTDIPFAEYPAYGSMDENNIQMSVGCYTAWPVEGRGDIKSISVPPRKTVVCLHKGGYDELAELYNEMEQWARDKGYEPSGKSIEHYYTGPEVPEPEQVTRVVMPLK